MKRCLLKDQIVNLELSKKLRELGVKQESLWCWAKDGSLFNDGEMGLRLTHQVKDGISAFTVAELGKLLPERFLSWRKENDDGFVVSFPLDEVKQPHYAEYALTEADTRAKMLVYLIENKLIRLNH